MCVALFSFHISHFASSFAVAYYPYRYLSICFALIWFWIRNAVRWTLKFIQVYENESLCLALYSAAWSSHSLANAKQI